MMQYKIVMAAQWGAATLLASWAWFLAQASSVDTVERWVGGTAVTAAAIAIVYFTLKFSANQKDSWTRLLADERASAALARAERDSAMNRLTECQLKLDDERKLRMALEEMGLHDRRRSIEEKEQRDS